MQSLFPTILWEAEEAGNAATTATETGEDEGETETGEDDDEMETVRATKAANDAEIAVETKERVAGDDVRTA